MRDTIRVLYGDESESDRRLVRSALENSRHQFTITEAVSRQEFESRLVENEFDVVVADLEFFGKDGLQALASLRSKLPSVPVVIVARAGAENAALEMVRGGAADYIVKSAAHIERLPEAIRSAVEKGRTEQEHRRALLELSESQTQLMGIIGSAMDAIITVDADQRIVLFNRAAERVFQYSASQVIGRPLDILLPEGFRLAHRGDVAHFAETRETRRQGGALGEVTGLRADGCEFPLEAAISQSEVSKNKFFTVVLRDITERKRSDEALVQERNVLRTLIDSLPEYIYIKDADGRFITTNWANVMVLKAETPERAVGKTDFDFYSAEEAARYRADEQAIMRSGQAMVGKEEQGVDAAGNERWTMTTKVPLRDSQGKVVGLVGVGHDITQRRRMEEELRQRLAELEAVNKVSVALRVARTVDEILPLLLDETLAVLNSETGAIWLADAARRKIIPAVARGVFAQVFDSPFDASQGALGSIFTTGEPYVSREIASDPRESDWTRSRMPRGWGSALVPIRSGEEAIGVFSIGVHLPRVVQPREVSLLTTLAEIAGNAIHRTRLHEQTQRQLQQLMGLRAIDLAINASLDLRVTLQVLLDHLVAQMHVDAADVLLLNPGMQRLEYAAGRGFRTEGIARSSLRWGEGLAGTAALERRLVAVANLAESGESNVRRSLLALEGFVAYYGIPLIAKGQVKGILEIFHRAPLSSDQEWLDFLESLSNQAAIAIDNASLFDEQQRSNFELTLAYDATIEGWSRALDLRDRETEGHTQRAAEMTMRVAGEMGVKEPELVHIRRGVLLHDIGKMGVPDHILFKPGPLSADEWEVMRRHPVYAHEMLSPIQFLSPALDIPYCHHEKWDGTGYPRQLKEERIPLSARIFAIVDVWDALRSDRPYRSAWTASKTREYLRDESGHHFDPKVARTFLGLLEDE